MRKGNFFSCKAIVLLCGILFFFSYRLLVPEGSRAAGPGNGTGGAYAVLAVDENENDRNIREALTGIGSFISESSQEILLDDFGLLKNVPLDGYSVDVEAFDPRNDGYAEKVRAFFIQGGKRFFFLPMDGLSLGGFSGSLAAKMEKEIAAILNGIPHTFSVLHQMSAPLLPLVFFTAACGAAFCLSRSRRHFIYMLPALLAFGWWASPFVPAGLLSGVWELLREPVGEIKAAHHYRRRFAAARANYAGAGMKGMLELLAPFRLNLLLVFLFVALYAAFSMDQGLFPIPAAAGLAAFFFFCFLSFKVTAKRISDREHIIFTPVLLPPFRAKTFNLFPFLLPFGLSALLALLFPFSFQRFAPSRAPYPLIGPQYLVSAEDYLRHVAFQQSFSYLSLNDGLYMEMMANPEFDPTLDMEPFLRDEYLKYNMGEDGLIAGSGAYISGSYYDFSNFDDPGVMVRRAGIGEVARFPLEKLMDFLVEYFEEGSSGLRSFGPGVSRIQVKEWFSMAMLFAICAFDIVRPGKSGRKRKNNQEFPDKRIAA